MTTLPIYTQCCQLPKNKIKTFENIAKPKTILIWATIVFVNFRENGKKKCSETTSLFKKINTGIYQMNPNIIDHLSN